MEDSGEVSQFFGIKISQDCAMRTMMIGQSGYIDQVLAKHLDKRTKPTMVPMQSILEGTLVASTAQQKEYLVIIGKLLWVANSIRPDLSLTMGVLARHMREPSQEHYQAAQQVLRYLESTKEVGLVYRANESQEPLVVHSDANWVSDATVQRRSTSGCHGPECSGRRRAPVESMAVVQSPWRPWTPTDSHAKEERAHMRGGAAKKRTKLKEHADGYHSGAREIRAKGTITGRRRRSSV
ncbi:uncharacterized protein UDID_17412 [Ustilago sp. UG-2017a]|nr:uncharacterized protein UDID_17412 [Ustilago sp. UG-2017a]